jgi:hypothetical protein
MDVSGCVGVVGMFLVVWVLYGCFWLCGCCRDVSGCVGVVGMFLVVWVL